MTRRYDVPVNAPDPLAEAWAAHLRCPVSAFSSGLTVIASAEMQRQRRLISYVASGGSVVLAPPNVTQEFGLQHPATGAALLAAMPAAVLAWTDLVYSLDPTRLTAPDPRVRTLTPADAPAVAELHAACSAADRQLGEVGLDHPIAVGAFKGEQLLAAASLIFQDNNVADVGVLTRPQARGQGLGAAVVGELCRLGLRAGRVLQYSTQELNRSSQRLAKRAGFRLFLTEYGVQLAP